MGTDSSRFIRELIRTEVHGYDVISALADKSVIAVVNHQCHLVRENRDIIEADWCSVESGFSDPNLSVNSGILLISPISPWNV